jgi:hypothetical protein
MGGQMIHNELLIEDRLSGKYGSVHASGKHIPPRAVRLIVVHVLVRGAPRQKPGKVRPLSAILAVKDAEGNQQRVRLVLPPIDPDATALL